MSKELYLECFQHGEPAGLPRPTVRSLFPVVEAESEHDDWFVEYPSGEACLVGVEPLDGADDRITSITISEFCEDPGFWDGILRLMQVGNVVLSCSDTDAMIVASETVFPHLPDHLIDDYYDTDTVDQPEAIQDRYDEFTVVDSVTALKDAFSEQVFTEGESEEFTWTWWLCGVVGGIALCLMTLINAVRAIPEIIGGAAVPWRELAILPLQLFGLGFVCGLIVWFLRGASERLGWIGDALMGMVVTKVFFVGCMLCFAPELLDTKISDGIIMLAFATVIGAIAGPFWGREIRKEFKGPKA